MDPRQFGLDKPPQFAPDTRDGAMMDNLADMMSYLDPQDPEARQGMTMDVLRDMVENPEVAYQQALGQMQPGQYDPQAPEYDPYDKVLRQSLLDGISRDEGRDPAVMMDDYPPQSGSSPMPQDITSILNIAVKLLGLAAQMGYGQEPDMMPDHQQQRPPVYDREPYDENEMQYQAERSYPR
jgi:hypothetical protein